MSVLLLTKAGHPWAERVIADVRRWEPKAQIDLGSHDPELGVDPWRISAAIGHWEGDWILSYCYPHKVPGYVLKKAKKGAINFHPAPPEYRGVGGVNWALYEGAEQFGVTSHYMVDEIDAGQIIRTRHFPIYPADTATSLLERTYHMLYAVWVEVMAQIARDRLGPTWDVTRSSVPEWGSRLRTRAELNALGQITPDMGDDEIRRRVRAVEHPNWPTASVTLGGITFYAERQHGM